MRNGIRVGRLFGIEVIIHPSWFIILAVVVWSLATAVFPVSYDWSAATYWMVSFFAAVLLFLSVLAHELAHSLVARRQGIPVKSITLFLLGGLASLEKEPDSPGHEALMAGAGPLTSVVIGGGSWGLGALIAEPEAVRAVLLYLGGVNVLLAAFNMLPGFPLDGGRVLRAVLWRITGSFSRATRGASNAGTVLGYLIILGAVFVAVRQSLISGLWLGFVGWVLVQASRASYASATGTDVASVGRLMTLARGWLPPDVPVGTAVQRYFSSPDTRCLPVGVVNDGGRPRLEGLLCRSQLQDDERNGAETVRDRMTPVDRMVSVSPEAPVAEARRLMAEHELQEIAVMHEGRLLGFVERRRLPRSRTASQERAGRAA